jgi:hypothetical protein
VARKYSRDPKARKCSQVLGRPKSAVIQVPPFETSRAITGPAQFADASKPIHFTNLYHLRPFFDWFKRFLRLQPVAALTGSLFFPFSFLTASYSPAPLKHSLISYLVSYVAGLLLAQLSPWFTSLSLERFDLGFHVPQDWPPDREPPVARAPLVHPTPSRSAEAPQPLTACRSSHVPDDCYSSPLCVHTALFLRRNRRMTKG